MNELALFAGAGGGILGGTLLGWRTVCAVEIDRYAASVLLSRQNDEILPPFPVWDDVRTFNGLDWCGIIDVISGGFPCQDISCAGKGAGITGERSGLWKEFARIIREVGPRYVFVENSPLLKKRGLDVVLGDLHEMGYDAEWGVLGADDAGAPHRRKRIWIVAYTSDVRCNTRRTEQSLQRIRSYGEAQSMAHSPRIIEGRQEQRSERERIGESGKSIDVGDPRSIRCEDSGGAHRGVFIKAGPEKKIEQSETIGTGILPDTDKIRRNGRTGGCGKRRGGQLENVDWWLSEPDVGRVANGVAARVDRLKAIGNGQVPAVAALAWNTLIERMAL